MATVLVLGATGFMGRHLVAALARAGHDVICGVRDPARGPAGCRSIPVDFTRDHTVDAWLPRLERVDVVVNAVGILRETRNAKFDALHVAAPRALFTAAVQAGVKKVVQISALGADADAQSRYHRTKKAADDFLATLPVAWTIVQPSLVYGEGGTSARLFSRLASLPLVLLPGKGDQRVQPVHIDDLVELVVRLVEHGAGDRMRIAAVGPEALTFRAFLGRLRAAMGLGRARFMPEPMFIMRMAAAIGEYLPGALLDRESLQMLERGNVASDSTMTRILGRRPRGIESFIPPERAEATANAARLAWLLPVLRVSVAVVWIVTGIVSLGVYPVSESYALLARVGLTGTLATVALYGAALLDLAFGIGVLVLRRRLWLWRAQAVLILAYTVIITVSLPEYWLHPYGPVLKNLPMLAAILFLHEFERS